MNSEPGSAYSTLRAGAARVDITPPLGALLGGLVHVKRPARRVLDPLHAGAIVIESSGPGAGTICLLSLEVLFVTAPFTFALRRAIAAEHGIPPEALLVHAVQNHNAPSLGPILLDTWDLPPEALWLRLGEDEYFAQALEGSLRAVREAMAGLQPAQLRVGRAIEGRVAFNRRAVGVDGRVFMPGWRRHLPLEQPRIAWMEGPVDPEVGVAAFCDLNQQPFAMLLHHTCHPVHYFHNGRGEVSADWPGAWCRSMQEAFPAAVPLVLNGCCGNINPWDPFDPHYQENPARVGQLLGDAARVALESAASVEGTRVDWHQRWVDLPRREVPPELALPARRRIAEQPGPVWTDDSREAVDGDWLQAAMLVDLDNLYRSGEPLPYEVQALRVGPLALLGLAGEPHVEGQLDIKLQSPFEWTQVAHACSHYAGYLPHRDAYARGGHEANLSSWSRVHPGALELVVENSLQALHQLHS